MSHIPKISLPGNEANVVREQNSARRRGWERLGGKVPSSVPAGWTDPRGQPHLPGTRGSAHTEPPHRASTPPHQHNLQSSALCLWPKTQRLTPGHTKERVKPFRSQNREQTGTAPGEWGVLEQENWPQDHLTPCFTGKPSEALSIHLAVWGHQHAGALQGQSPSTHLHAPQLSIQSQNPSDLIMITFSLLPPPPNDLTQWEQRSGGRDALPGTGCGGSFCKACSPHCRAETSPLATRPSPRSLATLPRFIHSFNKH